MTEDLKDLLRNCLTALNNATEEDIVKIEKALEKLDAKDLSVEDMIRKGLAVLGR